MPSSQAYEHEQQRFNNWYASFSVKGHLMYAGAILHHAVRLYADRVALIYKETQITYRTLYNASCSITDMLKNKGVKPRDRVIICFENSPDFYRVYFGVWQAGAVVVPLNTFLGKVELEHVIRDSQPVLVLTESTRVESFAHIKVTLITEKDLPEWDNDKNYSYDEVLSTLDQHEMAALLYTSGTTGLPKGVMLSSRNIMINLIQVVTRFSLVQNKQERIFAVLPLFHVFAQNTCVWGAILVGATVIVVPKIERKAILEGLTHKPTLFLGVPALYGLLCLLKTAPLDSVEHFISGGDALPDRIRIAFGLLYHRKLCNGYGLTETSPFIAVTFDDVLMPANIIGKPSFGIDVAIRDEQGRDVQQGIIGQLWVKGENVMLGYYNAPEMTAAIMHNGWLNTGDLAYITKQGNIAIAGREKDLIIHKGFNIYPQEIENIIITHPNVVAVGVVGKKDTMYGEIPVAFVQIRNEDVQMVSALQTLCKQHLAIYKIPRIFICSTQPLTTTATGKVDKKVLRRQLQQEINNEADTYYFKS